MGALMINISIFLGLTVILCVPPFIMLQMLIRRRPWARPGHQTAYLLAIGATGAALAFNLLVTTFAAPRLAGSSILEALDALHLVALGLSWLCFWGAVALAVLIRRKRNLMA